MEHPTEDIAKGTALVLETNNLRAGDNERAFGSLLRVVGVLAQQTVPLTTLAQLIITHDGLHADAMAKVSEAAGRYVDFVQIGPDTDYYEAKNRGFDMTDPERCRYVVFADADCMPAADWLARLLAPLAHPNAPRAVAGRTSYPSSVAGTALTTIDFMYFPSPLGTGATRNFYANNVLFDRALFARHRYVPLEGIYRAPCQVLGLRLHAEGVIVHFAADAHTVHRFPDTRRETFKLRWLRGEDCCGLTPHLVRAHLPERLQWLARSGPVGPLCVLLGRLWYSLGALNHQHMPGLRGFRRLRALVWILAFSAVDMCGALCRSAGFRIRHSSGTALSYHRPTAKGLNV